MKQNDCKKTVERQTRGKRSKKRELFQKLQTPSKDLPNPRMLKNSIGFWIYPSCPADKLIREEARRKSTSLTYPAVQLQSAENTYDSPIYSHEILILRQSHLPLTLALLSFV